MSIKNKKSIKHSNNAYRLRRIEEYLISQGYSSSDDANPCTRVWVDCVGNGRNISYTLNRVADPYSESVLSGNFNVMCTHSTYLGSRRVYKTVHSLLSAIRHSRDNPRW